MAPSMSNRPVALVCGAGNGLGASVAALLTDAGCAVYLTDGPYHRSRLEDVERRLRDDDRAVIGTRLDTRDDPRATVNAAFESAGRLDHFVDLCVPTAAWSSRDLAEYPAALLERSVAAAEHLVGSPSQGSAVLQCFLPSMFAYTDFDPYIPMLKAAATGITRTLCRRYSPRGLIVNCLHTGLLDLEETRAVADERVRQTHAPLGRWATPLEVARFVTFLVLSRGYLTGQTVVVDGGLTAGPGGN